MEELVLAAHLNVPVVMMSLKNGCCVNLARCLSSHGGKMKSNQAVSLCVCVCVSDTVCVTLCVSNVRIKLRKYQSAFLNNECTYIFCDWKTYIDMSYYYRQYYIIISYSLVYSS